MQPPPSPIRKTHASKITNPVRGSTTPTPTPPSRSSTSLHATTPTNPPTAALSAALQGATLAFNKTNNNNPRKPPAAAAGPASVAATGDTTGVHTHAHTQHTTAPTPPRGRDSPTTTTSRPRSPPASVPRVSPARTGSANIIPAAKLNHDIGGQPGGTGLKGDNGALVAAMQAAARGVRGKGGVGGVGVGGEAGAGAVSRQVTGGGGGTGLLLGAGQQERLGGVDGLLPPPSVVGERQPASSPSLIAATLAASRSVSPIRPLELGAGRVAAGVRAADADALDTASIPPTTSLVSLFEGKKLGEDVDPVKRRAPSLKSGGGDKDGQQPSMERGQQDQESVQAKPKPKPKPKPKLSVDLGSAIAPVKSAESVPDVSQKRATQGEVIRGEEKHPEGTSLSHRRTESERSRPQPPSKPKPRADGRPLTPTSPTAPFPTRNASQKPISGPARKPTETPRLQPPVPPARTSGILKMDDPTIQITPVEPEGDQINAFQRHQEQLRRLQEQTPKPRRPSQSSASSDDTFVSASSGQSRPVSPATEAYKTPRPSRPQLMTGGSSARSLSSPDLQRPPAPHTSSPNFNLASLTNAIVASNLASARLSVPSPSGPPPVPAPRRSGRSPLQPQRTADSIRSQLTGSSKSPNRTTPQRTGMLQTLRGPHPSLSDDEDARRRRKHNPHHHSNHHHRHHRPKVLGGSGRKHAHHEGARRRWRDEITPRERRRYEAVWASNRGLFLRPGWGLRGEDVAPPPRPEQNDDAADLHARMLDRGRAAEGPEAELVVNVVVRDIWCRSRLPADELAEVWELVDRDQKGALAREEFVVGLWLIDQRLKGRKIPARVSASVWESAGGGHGVVVPLPGGRKGR